MSWKEWDQGEVVEAGDLQEYIQDQVVQNYADSAARSTALGTAVAEGMVSYLQDSNSVQVYDGSAWQAVAPVSHNYITNGAFDINQRGFVTTTTNGNFLFDRWQYAASGGTATLAASTFTLGAAPVAGYEGKNYLNFDVTTGNDQCRVQHKLEGVRTLAGQTATLSFWAKGTNPATAGNLAVEFRQNFGTGGSPSSEVVLTQQTFVLTANWTRYSFVFAIPSIAGKTIGTANNDFLALFIGQGTSTATDAWELDLWGVQLEAGSIATPFKRNANSIQGELAACQRYFQQITIPAGTVGVLTPYGAAASSTSAVIFFPLKTSLRDTPNEVNFSNLKLSDGISGYSVTNVTIWNRTNKENAALIVTSSGLTVRNPYFLEKDTTASESILGVGSEL